MLRNFIPALLIALTSLTAAETSTDTETETGTNTGTGAGVTLIVPSPTQQEALQKHGDGWMWGSFAVTGVPARGVTVSTAIGAVTIADGLLRNAQGPTLLAKLVASASAAHKTAATALLFSDHNLAGPCLTEYAAWMVCADGVLIRMAKAGERIQAARSAEIAALKTTTTALLAAIAADTASGALDARGRDALKDVLDLLPKRVTRNQDPEELSPDIARRMVRGGLLDQLPRVQSEAKALRDAVEAAAHLTAIDGYASSDGAARLEQVADAFGASASVFVSPTRCAYETRHPQPEFGGEINARVVVDLKPGSDLQRDADAVVAARSLVGPTMVASWSASAGLTAPIATWRKQVNGRSRNGLPEALPPHLMIPSLYGDPVLLAVPRGALRRPATSTTSDGERFLNDAATLLPDISYLDLVGQYFFRYTFDSPDPRYPALPGNKKVNGEIHNTALQTLATQTCGLFRGDCDDAAELYQDIAQRQGRLGHVASLPGHAAFVTARKDGDEWVVNVLQTGPGMEFRADTLPEALRATYVSFNENAPFDPNGLGLLLRFSGENTRGSWRLGWRIFAEPEYARTMIDVQRDWQYQTYARGIDKMQKLVAAGDTDPANISELSGLYAFTGQYDKAVAMSRQALAAIKDEDAKVMRQIELIGLLRQAQKQPEAAALADEVATRIDSPAEREALGRGVLELGFDLAGQYAALGQPDKAVQIIDQTLRPQIDELMGQVIAWLSSPRFDQQAWDSSSQFRSMRSLFQRYAGTCMAVVEAAPSASRASPRFAALRLTARKWIEKIGFRDIDDPGEIHARYAFLAAILATEQDPETLAQEIAAAPFPTSATIRHDRRGGAEQRARDLSWIKLAVPWWYGRQMKASGGDPEAAEAMAHVTGLPASGTAAAGVDRSAVSAAAAGLQAAFTASAGLKLVNGQMEMLLHMSRLDLALLTGNAAEVRARLVHVAEQNDKRLRDMTATLIGNRAHACSARWFAEVLDLWQQELNYKPKWYLIAWRAALSGAPDKAILTAERAAKLFADDASFAEELAFMRTLFGQAKADAKAAVR